MTDDLDPSHRQLDHAVRFDWGATGAAAIATGGARVDFAVVVDVLSFTTTLSVALERGITVYPYPWHDAGAAAYASEHDAVLAVGRFEQRSGVSGVSLSPAAMERVSGVARVVLPSPNGSSIVFGLAEAGVNVMGACLRNASTVGSWLARRRADGATVAVVAAGERWPDGSLRPAVEDLWGAGAVLAALSRSSGNDEALSPEARQAVVAYDQVADSMARSLARCASALELAAAGFGDDVSVAAETDVSRVIPILTDRRFAPGAASPHP